MSDYEDFVIYEDELQLLDWEDTSRGGLTARFRLPAGDYETNPFKRFPIGTRFYARMIEIGDDDQPVDQEKKEAMRKAIEEREIKGGKLARDAGILCNDAKFQSWVVDQLLTAQPTDKRAMAANMPPTILTALKQQGDGILDDPRVGGETAKWFLYGLCKIKSRRELDHKTDAANRYYQHILKPFSNWRGST